MKKLLTLPIALLACASLLVGCSKGENQKKSEQSSPVEPTSSEPSEVPPEPGEDEEEIKFPESIDDAKLIDFGTLVYDQEKVFDFLDNGIYSEDDISLSASMVKNYYSYMEYDFQYEEYEKRYENLFAEFFEDGIYHAFNCTDVYYEYEGIGTLLEDFNHVKVTGVTKDETPYYYVDLEQHNGSSRMWYIGDPINNYAMTIFGQILFYIDDFGNFSNCVYRKIGNYHYFLDATREYNTYYFTDYSGTSRYTLKRSNYERVFKFDDDYRLLGFYIYGEEKVDHDLYSGQLLPEPKVTYKYCDLYEIEYKENNVYPEKEALINSIPEVQIASGSYNYRVGSVLLGESGQLTAEPDFPEEYTTQNLIYSYDDEHFCMYFSTSSDSAYAIDFDTFIITYTVFQGQDVGTEKTFTFDMYDVYHAKIAEALGAEIKSFGGNNYFVMEGGTTASLCIIIPMYEEPNASNVQFIAVDPN